MKYILFVMTFLSLIHVAHAGSQNCTDTPTVVTSGDYHTDPRDCTIRVSKATFQETIVYLPAEPSENDEFTVQEDMNVEALFCDLYEEPDTYYCTGAGLHVRSADPGVTVDGGTDVSMYSMHLLPRPLNWRQSARFIYDGAGNWEPSYDTY